MGADSWVGDEPGVMPVPYGPGIFVAGVMRSGTTWLGLLLGETAGYVCLGEISGVIHDAERGGRCACGELIYDCLVWGPSLRELRQGDPTAVAAMERTLLSASRTRSNLPLLLRSPVFAVDERPLAGRVTTLIDDVVAKSGRRGFVDTSKTLGMWTFHGLCGRHMHMVHVVKDPWGVARSNKATRYLQPLSQAFDPPGCSPFRSALRWLLHNTAIIVVSCLRREPHAFTTYETLCESPKLETERILRALGVAPNGATESDINHAAVGNPSRYLGTHIKISSPPTALSWSETVQVGIITAPLRLWFSLSGRRQYTFRQESRARSAYN